MSEALNILFHPLPNAIMTVLTGLSLLYWLFTMLLGDGFDVGSSDTAFEFEGADVQDMDATAEADASTEQAEPSFLTKAMDFINMGKAPMMVIVTLFKFIGLIITILASLTFDLSAYGWKSVLILIPTLLLSYLALHYVTIPVVRLYKNVGYMGEEAHEFLGRNGKMKSTIEGDYIGSAEIIIKNDVIRLNVKSKDGSKINYDDTIIIIDETKDKKYYYVQKVINLDNIHI